MKEARTTDRLERMRAKQARRIAIRDFKRSIFSLFADTLFIAVLWMFISYVSHVPARGSAPFLVVPWSVVLLVAVVLADGGAAGAGHPAVEHTTM